MFLAFSVSSFFSKLPAFLITCCVLWIMHSKIEMALHLRTLQLLLYFLPNGLHIIVLPLSNLCPLGICIPLQPLHFLLRTCFPTYLFAISQVKNIEGYFDSLWSDAVHISGISSNGLWQMQLKSISKSAQTLQNVRISLEFQFAFTICLATCFQIYLFGLTLNELSPITFNWLS